MNRIDEWKALLEFAQSDAQRAALEAAIETGSIKQAAIRLNKQRSSIRKSINTVRRYAARKGFAPEHDMTHTTPDTHYVKGVSTLYDQDGNKRLQWVKTSADQQAWVETQKAIVEALKEDIPRDRLDIGAPAATDADLLAQYTITDYHLGMLAWHEEGGDDWDVSIAEQLLVNWFKRAINSAPAAEQAVLCQLGDFMHWDGLEAVTPTNRHILDADGRFPKIVRVAMRSLRRVVNMLLQKHQRVHIICAEGNHDLASSVWLREHFATLYENEPRVTVETRPDPYYCYEFGDVALFYHHGHKKSIKEIDRVFASKFRDVFGRTRYAYGHIGHYHIDELLETALMKVERHRTLAASDSHASRGGYQSGRDAKVIIYHRKHGEYERHVINPDMAGEESA